MLADRRAALAGREISHEIAPASGGTWESPASTWLCELMTRSWCSVYQSAESARCARRSRCSALCCHNHILSVDRTTTSLIFESDCAKHSPDGPRSHDATHGVPALPRPVARSLARRYCMRRGIQDAAAAADTHSQGQWRRSVPRRPGINQQLPSRGVGTIL